MGNESASRVCFVDEVENVARWWLYGEAWLYADDDGDEYPAPTSEQVAAVREHVVGLVQRKFKVPVENIEVVDVPVYERDEVLGRYCRPGTRVVGWDDLLPARLRHQRYDFR